MAVKKSNTKEVKGTKNTEKGNNDVSGLDVNVTTETQNNDVTVDATPVNDNTVENSVSTEETTTNEEETTAPAIEVTEAPVLEPETSVGVEMFEEETKGDKENTSDVDVNLNAKATVSNPKKVKIRMRANHKCVIAMQTYDLKAGKVYTVPVNVKNILNRAGLLSPL